LIRSLAVVNLLGAAALGAARLNWPSQQFWAGKTGWLMVALGVTLMAPLALTFVAERGSGHGGAPSNSRTECRVAS
jgi:hypothetical protein